MLDAAIASLRITLAAGTLGQVGEIPPASNMPPGTTFGNPCSTFGSEVPAGAQERHGCAPRLLQRPPR